MNRSSLMRHGAEHRGLLRGQSSKIGCGNTFLCAGLLMEEGALLIDFSATFTFMRAHSRPARRHWMFRLLEGSEETGFRKGACNGCIRKK
ncbi:hypothetical protein AVEN_134034-1 [Araneus ventricosus]|uniref:Uncharacterized protein n=1 Tax=Araneus ventricosus TaxID=182803 RepID=A0A4Y2K5C3_ARAVE|nr:hypothetical protein AVEN_134034-1 [Araneus ventricosus]